MRKAVQVTAAGARLFGTIHMPSGDGKLASPRIALLLLSFGQQPRSWIGDLGTAIAERAAAAGFLSFRFDMPGLGDSPGDLPLLRETIWRDIQMGAHSPYLHALCWELQEEYRLEGLVVGGLCGGAVTSLYAVNSSRVKLKGLLLLEPEIALTNADAGMPSSPADERLDVEHFLERKELFFQRLFSFRSWRKLIAGKADYRYWKVLFVQSRENLSRRFSHRRDYPPETNHGLLDAWDRARRRSIPTLVVSVASASRRAYYRSYRLEPGIDQPGTRLAWIEIPNTTHALLAGGAKDAICGYVAKWLSSLSS